MRLMDEMSLRRVEAVKETSLFAAMTFTYD
jgi:hypothetical protein